MSLIIQSPEKQWLDLFENLSLHNAFFIDSVFNHFIDSMHYALVVTDSEWVVWQSRNEINFLFTFQTEMLIKRWKILNQNATKEASKPSKTFMVLPFQFSMHKTLPNRFGWKICQITKVN